MHEKRSSLSGDDKTRVEALETVVARLDKYVKHIVSLLPEDQRTPKEPSSDEPPIVVSVGSALRDEAMAALRAELEQTKALPQPRRQHRAGK